MRHIEEVDVGEDGQIAGLESVPWLEMDEDEKMVRAADLVGVAGVVELRQKIELFIGM